MFRDCCFTDGGASQGLDGVCVKLSNFHCSAGIIRKQIEEKGYVCLWLWLFVMTMAMAAAYEATAGYGNASSMKLGFSSVSICLIVSGMEAEGIPRVSLVSAIIEG